MLIILEGVDGSGKTTISRALNDLLPLSTLIKLSGAPKYVNEEEWMEETYRDLIPFLVRQSTKGHVIVDRFMPSEYVYAPLFKGYSPSYFDEFTDTIHRHTATYYFYLSVTDEILEKRLAAKAEEQPNENHISLDVLHKVKSAYDEWFNKYQAKYPGHYYKITHESEEVGPTDYAKFIIKTLNIGYVKKDDTYSRPLVDLLLTGDGCGCGSCGCGGHGGVGHEED